MTAQAMIPLCSLGGCVTLCMAGQWAETELLSRPMQSCDNSTDAHMYSLDYARTQHKHSIACYHLLIASSPFPLITSDSPYSITIIGSYLCITLNLSA